MFTRFCIPYKNFIKKINIYYFEESFSAVVNQYVVAMLPYRNIQEKIAEEVGHKSVLTTMLNYSFDTQDDVENKRLINKGLNIHTA